MRVLVPFFSVLSLIACTFAVVASPPHQDGRTFDFIVVGAGAGGSPLASRLARAGFSVLLLDAGGDVSGHLTTQIPGMQGQASEDPAQRWDFYVDMYDDPKQQLKNVRMNWELPNGTIYTGLDPPSGAQKLGILYPRASGLGGCTMHNSLVALYPFIRDWELLQELTGNTTWWAPEKMRQYFERVERAEYLPNSVAGHGFSGWLHISLTALDIVAEDLKLLGVVLGAIRAAGKSLPSFGLGGLVDSLLSLPQAALTLGNLLLHDLNAPGRDRDSREGVWQIPISVDPSNSTRSSPYNLVRSTEDKYQLTVQLHTLVTKILFDQSGPRPRAIGVDYLEGESLYAADPRYDKSKKGKPGRAYAKYEVIVSTGAYNSPQLLKLSGVGPKKELARWKIPIVKHLPGVGENLQDRIEAVMVSQSTSDFSIVSSCTFLQPVPESDPCYLTWKSGVSPYLKGVYGSNGLALGVTFRSSVAEGIEPDVFISGVPIDFRGYAPYWATQGVQHTNHWTWYMLKAKNSNHAGSVTLKSTDARDTPQISFRTLGQKTLALKSDQDDLQALYEAFLQLRKMRDDFVPLDGSHFTEVWPGADVQTQEDIKEYLMDQTWGHHVGGGNKIGADDDPLAVLDSDMRVRGIDGLRVVDASAWPRTPGYFPVIWIYCVSERASDIIIAEYS